MVAGVITEVCELGFSLEMLVFGRMGFSKKGKAGRCIRKPPDRGCFRTSEM
jgi:hypothetical protein